MVLDKENAHARRGIFMIDASRGFLKDGNKNRLRSQDLHKIVDVFNKQTDLRGYSRVVSFKELEEEGFNPNIPRYIDSGEPEDLHDLSAHLNGGIPDLKTLMYLDDSLKRDFYAQMSRLEGWSSRQLRERMDSMLFERSAISKRPEETIGHELERLRATGQPSSELLLKDPYVLDFLGLNDRYLEKDLEDAVLRELEQFLLELGAGFTFVARQKRIQIDNDDFYIDLLLYNRKLRRLVALDFKLGSFRAEYKGQMELYLRWLAGTSKRTAKPHRWASSCAPARNRSRSSCWS